MNFSALFTKPYLKERSFRRHVALMLSGVGICAMGLAEYMSFPPISPILASCGLAACLAVVVYQAFVFVRDRIHHVWASEIVKFSENDSCPVFLTDEFGAILQQNQKSKDVFDGDSGGLGQISACLERVFADPVGLLLRLDKRSLVTGYASEDLVTPLGHARLSAHRFGLKRVIWRLESEYRLEPQKPSATNIPILSIDRTNTIISMNEAAQKFAGTRPKSLKSLFVDLPLRDGSVHTFKAKDNLVRVNVSLIESGFGRQDVLLLPNLGQECPENAEKFEFEVLPVPLIQLDRRGLITQSNIQARRLLYTETTKGKYLGDFMEGLGRSIPDWLEDATRDMPVSRSEFLRLTKPEREVFVQVTLNRVLDEDSQSLIAVLNDATELKSLEAQFVQSQKMQAIGQLAGGVAHDFNNLLTAISGHCDLLLLRHDQGDPEYGDLIQIHQNANRAASLVGQLLAFSRQQTLQTEVIDLREVLSDLTHLLNRLVGEKISLESKHSPLLPPIRADKRQLEQVIMNLVVNARDAMPNGGTIHIETELLTLQTRLERDRAVVPPGTYVSVRVKDNGIGIPSDKIRKVFEPFFTTKRTGEGTGLGLSTAYGIVKQTGGFIFVDSEAGVGTVFFLLFPAQHETPDAVLVPPEPVKSGVHTKVGGVVLLVEDEAPVRAFASRALRLKGYEVIEADSAETALAILEDQSLRIDVFVTDVVMPGLDGPTWVRKAQDQRPGTPVVFVSGYSEDVFDVTQNPVPNSVYLPKPFSLKELAEIVNTQMEETV